MSAQLGEIIGYTLIKEKNGFIRATNEIPKTFI